MSRKHPKTCEHCNVPLERMWDDSRDCYICEACYKPVAVNCPACGGEGDVYADDYECDWINEIHDLITCPECNGYGWTADPSFQ
jgi:hypothetical protein